MDNIQKIYLTKLFSVMLAGAITVPFFMDWGHLNFTQIFTLQMAFVFTISAMEFPTGVFADRYGRKTSLMVGFLCIVIGTLIYVSKPDFWVFFIAECIYGLGIAFISGADTAIVYDSLKEQGRTREAKQVFANLDIYSSVGFICAAPIGSMIAGALSAIAPENYRVVFALDALIFACGFIISSTLHEPKHFRKVKDSFKIAKRGFSLIFKNPALLAISLEVALVTALAFFVFWLYQPVLSSFGLPVAYWGFAAIALNIAGIAVLSKVHWLERKFGAKDMIFYCALIISAGYFTVYLSGSLWLSILSFAAIAAFRAVIFPFYSDVLNTALPSNVRATSNSVSSMLISAARFIIYPLIGFLADRSLGITFLFLGTATLAVTLAARYFYSKSGNKKQ